MGGLKVTYSYQVLKNGMEDVTNDVSVTPANAQHVRRRKRSDEHDAADGKGSFDDE